jgi:N-ethylmaleimide reductase
MMAEYYAQRASAGLVITEATGISLQGLGWPFGPDLWSNEQIEAWRENMRVLVEVLRSTQTSTK